MLAEKKNYFFGNIYILYFSFLPAGAEDDFVCLDAALGADQGHVDEILLV